MSQSLTLTIREKDREEREPKSSDTWEKDRGNVKLKDTEILRTQVFWYLGKGARQL